ncbi:MAG: helix-turn-helix transcriptional regulator [Bacteroidia bacterium]
MDSRKFFHEITILTPYDWEKFREEFEKRYPGFFILLHTHYPRLTPSEVRLMALMKLNFSIRMIATTLGISPQSIIKSRYRLKKKLELKKEEDLDSILEIF